MQRMKYFEEMPQGNTGQGDFLPGISKSGYFKYLLPVPHYMIVVLWLGLSV